MTYKGNTLGKEVNRGLVWLCHTAFLPHGCETPHVFLGSRCVGDVQTLKELGISGDRIWAVESDYREYRSLHEGVEAGEFRLWTDCVGDVCGEHTKSVYLDFCGNLWGEAHTIRKVVSQLATGTVLTITLYVGREQQPVESREDMLLEIIKSATSLHCTLLQEIQYVSAGEGLHSTRMATWTILLGTRQYCITPQRLDLTIERPTELWCLDKIRKTQHNQEIERMAQMMIGRETETYKGSQKAHMAALKAWRTRRQNAAKRSAAAHKAWKTRRAS